MNRRKTRITSRLVRHTNWRTRPFFWRVALSLACALTLPNPAFALREMGTDAQPVRTGLEQALKSGSSPSKPTLSQKPNTGLEENFRGKPVVQGLTGRYVPQVLQIEESIKESQGYQPWDRQKFDHHLEIEPLGSRIRRKGYVAAYGWDGPYSKDVAAFMVAEHDTRLDEVTILNIGLHPKLKAKITVLRALLEEYGSVSSIVVYALPLYRPLFEKLGFKEKKRPRKEVREKAFELIGPAVTIMEYHRPRPEPEPDLGSENLFRKFFQNVSYPPDQVVHDFLWKIVPVKTVAEIDPKATGRVYLIKEPTIPDIERLLRRRDREYDVYGVEILSKPCLLIEVGTDQNVGETTLDYFFQHRQVIKPDGLRLLIELHTHNRRTAFPSHLDFPGWTGLSLEWTELGGDHFVYGPRTGRLLRYGSEGPEVPKRIPPGIRLFVWKEGASQPEQSILPGTEGWTVSSIREKRLPSGSLGIRHFYGVLRQRDVTKVEIRDEYHQWVRWEKQVTLASVLQPFLASAVSNPAAGLEETWKGVIDDVFWEPGRYSKVEWVRGDADHALKNPSAVRDMVSHLKKFHRLLQSVLPPLSSQKATDVIAMEFNGHLIARMDYTARLHPEVLGPVLELLSQILFTRDETNRLASEIQSLLGNKVSFNVIMNLAKEFISLENQAQDLGGNVGVHVDAEFPQRVAFSWSILASPSGPASAGLEEHGANSKERRGLSGRVKRFLKQLILPLGIFDPSDPTTHLMLEAMERLASLSKNAQVLDTGAGTGVLGLAEVKLFKAYHLVATEPATYSLDTVQQNAFKLGISDQVETRKGSLFDPVNGSQFGVALFNAPDRDLAQAYVAGISTVLEKEGFALLMWHRNFEQNLFAVAVKAGLAHAAILKNRDGWRIYALTPSPRKLKLIQKQMAAGRSFRRQRISAAGLEEAEKAALEVLEKWADVKQAANRVLPAIVLGPSLVKRYAGELTALDRLLRHPELTQKNPMLDYVYLVTEGSQVPVEFLQKFDTASEARHALGERPIVYCRGHISEKLFSEQTDPHFIHLETLSSKSGPLSSLKYLLEKIRFSMEDAPRKERQFVFSEANRLAESLRQLTKELGEVRSLTPREVQILIVEDEKPVRERLVQEVFDALQSSSNPLAHQITREQIGAVASESEGVQWVEKKEPQFLWCDQVIIDGYGSDVARAAKGISSATVTVLSSSMGEKGVQMYIEDGTFDEFIPKWDASSEAIRVVVERYIISRLTAGLEEPQAIWTGLEEQWAGFRSRSTSDKAGWVLVGKDVAQEFPELPPLAGLEEHILIARGSPADTALDLAERNDVSSVHLFAGLEEAKRLTAALSPLGISAIIHDPKHSSFRLMLPEILHSLGIPKEAASAGLEEFSRQLKEFGEAA